MKKVALSLLIYSYAYICIGQTVLTKSQLFANPEWDNPSMTAMSDQLKLGFLYKQSINNSGNNISFVEGGVFMPISNTFNRETDNSNFILSAPSLSTQTENADRNSRQKHGLGINFSKLKLNEYQLSNIKLSYAYHLPISNKLNLSFGAGVNVRQTRFDVSSFTVEDPQNDLFYQQLVNGSFSGTLLLGSVGLSLYSSNMFLTATLDNINMYESGNINTETNTSILQPKISAAYKYAFNSSFYLIPHLSYLVNQQFNNQLLYNLRLNYKNQVYAGLGGENGRKISFMFGAKLPKAIFLDYAFDHYVNYGQIVAKGVHEIGLTYIFNNKKSVSPFLW